MVSTDRGDVVELLDAAGSPFAAYRYDAWGNPEGSGNVAPGIWSQSTGLISASVASDIASRQVLRYASYCYDSESGLYYLSARSYDPETRQFLSKDLARNDGEESAYQYGGGDPVGNVDPTGFMVADYQAESFVDEEAAVWYEAYGSLRASYASSIVHPKWQRPAIPEAMPAAPGVRLAVSTTRTVGVQPDMSHPVRPDMSFLRTS